MIFVSRIPLSSHYSSPTNVERPCKEAALAEHSKNGRGLQQKKKRDGDWGPFLRRAPQLEEGRIDRPVEC